MPIKYIETDIFQSDAQILVNPVNTEGVMGKGLALEFKKKYPQMYKQYRKYCLDEKLIIGKLYLFKSEDKWILNFPTKKNWREPSQLFFIEQGLDKFVETYQQKNIQSISFPKLGVGNGGLDWESEVKPLMEKYLDDLPITIYVHLFPTKK
ncbi:macro domain-containing protein [Companilactobacillus furfuricola]|uniref:macro domain-containing protein n=1 Tax=Companilactobacillus furfuricola TaxID=1462575 RepID=UPI000F778D94|nr:macro domain-containing protein [Companilactobacillus furfuricola]